WRVYNSEEELYKRAVKLLSKEAPYSEKDSMSISVLNDLSKQLYPVDAIELFDDYPSPGRMKYYADELVKQGLVISNDDDYSLPHAVKKAVIEVYSQ
ncbi:hypothetical protein AB4589_06845, partial [Vibrio sp. 10N.222.49.A3]